MKPVKQVIGMPGRLSSTIALPEQLLHKITSDGCTRQQYCQGGFIGPATFWWLCIPLVLIGLLAVDWWFIKYYWYQWTSLLVVLLFKDALLIISGSCLLIGLIRICGNAINNNSCRMHDMRVAEFIEKINDVAFIKDKKGHYKVLNAACLRWMGYSYNDCLDRTDMDLFPARMAQKLIEDDHRVLIEGCVRKSENIFIVDGETRVLLVTKWPYRDTSGHITGVIGIAHDITVQKQIEAQLQRTHEEMESRIHERTANLLAINRTLERQINARVSAEVALRDSEERFRQMAEHIREVFWVYSILDERLLYVSPAYEDIWGCSVQDIGNYPYNWIKSIHPDDRPRVQRAYAEELSTGHFEQEYRIIRPDGSIRWIWDRGFPIADEKGDAYRIVGLAEDITARRLAEDQLRRQQVDLSRMSRLNLAVELASGLAHELNQPLAAIVAYTQACLTLLQQDQTDPRKLASTLEDICSQGLRAGEIIRHLRELVNKSPAKQDAVDLNALIHNVIRYIQLELRQSGVASELYLSEALPTVLANNIQIQLVVLYLIRNALEAMQEIPEDEPHELSIYTSVFDSETAQVTICDTGHGLSPEVAERLFQPFFTTKPGGTGMSLSVSRSIIESQGGKLWVTLNTSQGASFHFTLPVYMYPDIDHLSE
ncbi:MAG: hypothetical protein CSA09_02795 [Candidatus Contendobacter odensis]|uniref:histidine kinase n=1 Tax=Candidatus Contendibacter odensensis TaxID=1400860 RepID=A0A2G6PF85_9GAMM|nr:MAG: hypothetical protein CSA09_02795 [Candidatus Contendobacter odensis]